MNRAVRTNRTDQIRPPRIPKSPPPEIAESPRIARLLEDLDRDPDALDSFRKELARVGTPLVQASPPGGYLVTFIWDASDGPQADEVALIANRLTDPSVISQSLLENVPGTGIWHRTFRLPVGLRSTYRLAPRGSERQSRGEPAPDRGPTTRWREFAAHAVPDPLNAECFPARHEETPWSVLSLPGAPDRELFETTPRVRGRVSASFVTSKALGEERRVWVYEPPTDIPVEHLAVLLDGDDWVGRLGGPVMLDNLIARGLIPPTLVLFPDSVDQGRRWKELSADPDFIRFLSEDLPAWAQTFAPGTGEPANTLVGGQSLGGLTAVAATTAKGSSYGHAVSVSGSFWDQQAGDDLRLHPVVADAAKDGPGCLHLSVGLQEWVLLPLHREFRDLVKTGGRSLDYQEFQGGHDAICWQTEMAVGLVRAFGEVSDQ